MPRTLALATSLALAGCGSLISASDYATQGPSHAYRDPADILPASCRPCLEQYCSPEIEACAADAECEAASRCLYGEVNPARGNECAAAHPSAMPVAASLGNCAISACGECREEAAWACVGDYAWPLPVNETEVFEDTLVDFVTGKPLGDVTVRACDRRDPECLEPFDEQTSDPSGKVTLTLPMLKKTGFGSGEDGFDGFRWLTGPGLRPTYRYANLPAVQGGAGVYAVANAATTQALAQATGIVVDPTRAVIVAEIKDCYSIHAAGVRFEADATDAASTPYYLVTGVPNTTQTETTANGIGGWVNVPPGQATIVAREANTGRELARSIVSTHAGATTVLVMLPSP